MRKSLLTAKVDQPTTPQPIIDAMQLRIKAAWQKAVSSIVETGQVLQAIRKDIPHGDWGRLFQGPNKPFSSRMAVMLITIAEHPVLSNPKHASDLPASWYSLFLLTAFDDAERLEQLIADHTVHAGLQRAEIEALLRREQSRMRRAVNLTRDHEEPFPQTVSDYRSPAQEAALQGNQRDVSETLRRLRHLLVDLQDAQQEIRRSSSLRKQVTAIADRLLAIVEDEPVLPRPEQAKEMQRPSNH